MANKNAKKKNAPERDPKPDRSFVGTMGGTT